MTDDRSHSRLFVGLGSPHGDDQAGWLVVSELERRLDGQSATVSCRKAKSPSDLLDWLDDVTHLVVCDACESSSQAGELRQWRWPADRFERTRASSSHHLGLPEVLDLAANLNRLPRLVQIWTIGGAAFSPGSGPSSALASACQRLATHLSEEVIRA